MRIVKVALFLVVVVLAASVAQALTHNRKTVVTFSHPVQIPGQVLDAGTYTFTILSTNAHRNIVQIWNADHTKLITTIIGIPNYRLKRTDKTVIEFDENSGNGPQALKAWFYPGEQYGIEFAYPKQEAIQIAKAANEPVPAEETEPATKTVATLSRVVIVAVVPSGQEEQLAEAFPEPATETAAKELPRTASSLPLLVLLGTLCLAVGYGFRRLGSRML